ncbi:MAG: c-type cytochrome [Hyphomonadaceae bacterium]
MRSFLIAAAAAMAAACTPAPPAKSAAAAGPHVAAADPVAAGRYLVQIGGCNDCHTAGFAESGGNVPESEWLKGGVGFRGPWGVTYPTNLRLSVEQGSEDEWVAAMHQRKTMPPMPWPAINAMSEQDLRAIYAYVKTLEPKGETAPANLPPGQEPKTPYYYFVPITGPAPH